MESLAAIMAAMDARLRVGRRFIVTVAAMEVDLDCRWWWVERKCCRRRHDVMFFSDIGVADYLYDAKGRPPKQSPSSPLFHRRIIYYLSINRKWLCNNNGIKNSTVMQIISSYIFGTLFIAYDTNESMSWFVSFHSSSRCFVFSTSSKLSLLLPSSALDKSSLIDDDDRMSATAAHFIPSA